jgi:hypothetical protein
MEAFRQAGVASIGCQYRAGLGDGGWSLESGEVMDVGCPWVGMGRGIEIGGLFR